MWRTGDEFILLELHHDVWLWLGIGGMGYGESSCGNELDIEGSPGLVVVVGSG